jgi:hypothetical protein
MLSHILFNSLMEATGGQLRCVGGGPFPAAVPIVGNDAFPDLMLTLELDGPLKRPEDHYCGIAVLENSQSEYCTFSVIDVLQLQLGITQHSRQTVTAHA